MKERIPYSRRYKEGQKLLHQQNCGKCPIYERAVEIDSKDWDYFRCSKLDCHILPQLTVNNNAKLFKRTRTPIWDESVMDNLETHIVNIKALLNAGFLQKEIAYIYRCSEQMMSDFCVKHKIQNRLPIQKILKNVPTKFKDYCFYRKNKKCQTNTTFGAGNWSTNPLEDSTQRDISLNARQEVTESTSSPYDNGTLPMRKSLCFGQ